jgi:nicotinic acid phosphoribosyltransferase
MLTDTYTVDVFFREFLSDPDRASRWNALRHDSGDPIDFAKQARKTWDEIAEKRGEEDQVGKVGRVIFSDGLDVDEALRIWRECEKIGINGKRYRRLCFWMRTQLTEWMSLMPHSLVRNRNTPDKRLPHD